MKPLLIYRRHRAGLSLIELIIVLGISSLVTVGSFAWFQSQKVAHFYDAVRQIEARVREVQSQNLSNLVPGYNKDDNSATGCNSRDRSTCVLQSGEEVYGTAVGMHFSAATDNVTKLRIYYLKQDSAANHPATGKPENVISHDPVDVDLPGGVLFTGLKVYGQSLSGSTYQCPTGFGSGDLKPEADTPALPNVRLFTNTTTPNGWSVISFRRSGGGINSFFDADRGADIFSGTFPFASASSSNPNGTNYPSALDVNSAVTYPKDAGWIGLYDSTHGYTSAAPSPPNPLPSQPCGVLWEFSSVEQFNGRPRFTAELNFNIKDNTIRTQTH